MKSLVFNSGSTVQRLNVFLWIWIVHSIIFICESKTIKTITIPHNVPLGHHITDIVDGSEGRIFIDSAHTEFHHLFDHLENGALVTKNHLTDFAGQTFSLVVKNGINDKLLQSLHIKITESKCLVFQQAKYVGTVKENQKKGTQVMISGHLSILDNEDVTYILLNGTEIFTVKIHNYENSHEIKVLTRKSLNREEISSYNLMLQAQSTEGNVAETLIEVHVLDANDNVPKFRKSLIEVQTSVDYLWNKITTVEAFDLDSQDRITYSLEGSGDFVIEPENGKVYAESDYLYPGSYSVQAYATDSAGHRSEPLNIHITVMSDSLRYMPQYRSHHVSKRATTTISKTFEIVENSTSTFSLFSVATIQPRPPSSTERYRLVSSTADLFQQPDANGNVYLKSGKRLDFEDVNHRQIVVVFNRTNTNAPQDFTIVEVTLRVQDKNDEKPIFKNKPVPFLAAVSTNPGLGEVVYTLYASDPDQNSNIIYNLESGGEGKFKMITELDTALNSDEMVGKIVTTVSGPGQFAEGVEYTLVVSAQDLAAGLSPPQKSEFAIVKVLVGFRPPQMYENPFMATVLENSGTGTKIFGESAALAIRAICFQDRSQNKLLYELTEMNGKISNLFSITTKKNVGYVETLQNLDYEKLPNQYVLNVTAIEVDTGLAGSSQLVIDVQDVNDNSPKFQLSTYMFTLLEDTDIGGPALPLEVRAEDRDSGVNSQLEYSVSDEHFSIQTSVINNQYIGQIKIAKKLDYDFRPDHQYRFNVTAKDRGEISRSGLATVIVYVKNVNDEAPVFSSGVDHLYASISEEQTVGSVVTIIQATDPDGDNIKYFFTPQMEDSSPFRIDPESGLITLTTSLPESVPYYTLNITAYDDGSCCPGSRTLSSDTYIIVEIKDTNNNQPQFPSCNYEPEVLENQNIGTFVVQVKAVDDDRGANGNITFSIVTSPRQPKQFEVDPNNGRVVTAVRFDREESQGGRGIPVTVKAADQGQPQSLDTHCTFWVRIGDVNDNSPMFDSPSYSTSISESAAVVGRRIFAVRATDKDQGKNADIVYSLEDNPGDFFRMEPDTGIIYLENGLYGKDNVMLRVKAEDHGDVPRSAVSSVSISVTDRTNNPPTWDSESYERDYEVKETAQIGYIIATMRASSNTPAPFDGLSFALIDSNENTVQQIGPFNIYQDGNMVSLRLKGTLDYNVQNKFELRLRVTNQGQTPLSIEIRPVVLVKDMNNEPPQFEGLDPNLSNSYRGSVPENEPPGQTVLKIKAVDRDNDPPNNLVSYSLMQDRNDAYMHFEINRDTGIITTRSQFDREEQSVYYIKVKAIDGINSDAPGHWPENTPNSATAQVQVIIADKNDNPPYFTQASWDISVPEQQPDSTGRILTVTAKDDDEADQLAYTITEGNQGNVFGIKQKTGELYVAKTLDYETPPTTYKLKVMVQDGRFENFTQVIVDVTDVNDNAPQFSKNVYEINNVVEETVPPYPDGQFLVQVSATDKDVSRQNSFRFFISGDGTNIADPTFTIEPDTGRIFLRKKLDRDSPAGREVYQFNVMAEDEPDTPDVLSGYAYVKVKPKDINDNSPIFKEEDLQGSVPEHSPAGQSVMTVVASDVDAGLNGTIFYEIDRFGNPPADPSGEHLFQINSETGLIQTKLADTLDREKRAQYHVTIVAKDRGIEQRSASATVTISVSDINDQIPQFVKKIYEVSMSENQVNGPVITVMATDNDIDENARLTYTLAESGRTYFSIETIPPNAGVLTVFRAVDYEQVKFFNLTVYVQDSNPEHKDEANIEVTVNDYNDNPPEFDPKVKTIRHLENIPEGTSLWNCSAKDRDNGLNAEFEYSIDRRTDEGRRFTVNSKCEVKVRRGLDGETLDREALAGLLEEKYEVHILATDKGYPAQTGTATLRILVDDINDNDPQLVLPHPAVVMELKDPPQFVVTFSAMDRDTPKYGAPFEFSLPPCDENPTCKDNVQEFSMKFDPNGDRGNGTGTVTALKKFNRDEGKFHYLPIIMSDMRGKKSPESRTGTSTLTIEIGDENNNPHSPGHKDIFVYKYDFAGVTDDLIIGNVYAEDKDDWDVKDKYFYFTGPPVMAKYFNVDLNHGVIGMNKQTPAGIHKFHAKVWDHEVFTDLNVSATVTVTVEEITDEAVFSSGSIRFTGLTAEEFIARRDHGKSPYDKFRVILARELRVPQKNVHLFSVMNGKNNAYTDLRYAAHGSPYYSPSKLNGIVALNKQEFEDKVGITVTMVNIDMCLREVCESGGCSNILSIGDQPNYVNNNGTSFIGISTSVTAECQCRAQNFSSPPACTPTYCLNGGQCVKDDWGDVKCINCPRGYDGKRCQMIRHSFAGGYALFSPFEQCEESATSVEFLTTKGSGLIFYNGPVAELGRDDPTDFIALSLVDGYPLLQLDHGSGQVNLALDGRDLNGDRWLQKLDDGRWHHIDIIRKGKSVTMTVDRCEMNALDGGSEVSSDMSSCEVTGKTPGENFFLNVNTMLQMGGRYIEPTVPDDITSVRFKGCVRNLIHNGELYDLDSGKYSMGENHVNGCPDEDLVCGVNSLAGKKCGEHGICEVIDLQNSQYKCSCEPGYRTSGADDENCNIETTVRDLKDSSFMTWNLKTDFLNTQIQPRTTDMQLRFRTRDPDGILFHLPSNTEEFITLEIVGGRVQVLYNLGGSDGESTLSLTNAPASNGQWHTVYMTRIGKWFQLKMDGGEGRYVNETWGSPGGSQMITIKMYQIVSGAHVVFSINPIAQGQDLNSTCIEDIRLNNKWFPLINSENELSEAATLEYEQNVENDCTREDCVDAICPTGLPFSMVCYPLWGTYECRCPAGTFPDGYNCLPIDYCELDTPCFVGATCITKPYPASYTCVCPSGWTGRLCNLLSATTPAQAGITTGFIVIIVVCIFVVLVIALLVFLIARYKKRKDPEKYILDDDIDDDIRENVINYNEEGAGEEDQEGYDINRLRKPDDGDGYRKYYDPLQTAVYPGRPSGDRPDVGDFIDERLGDADQDPAAPPHDSVREFVYEGGESDAGSLSSLQTSSSTEDQDYDYLNDWGPKFSKLANMYGGDEEDL